MKKKTYKEAKDEEDGDHDINGENEDPGLLSVTYIISRVHTVEVRRKGGGGEEGIFFHGECF